ncbi:MAG: response regulator [Actinobacteria bacterium]|nr:response regulator [Actinomycetota bacterium]
MTEDRHDLVLVCDDDPDILRFVEFSLKLEGYEVATAEDGAKALTVAQELQPDLVLLDVMMPKLDGFEVCEQLRADARTKYMSIIMLTAKSLSADRVVGLTAGADDYIIKPFDPTELLARVKSTLRRAREMRALNPLTQLAGNVQVQAELSDRVDKGEPFSLMYADLDNFKAFNDYYGFLRGDEAIKLLARSIGEAVRRYGGGRSFVGHVGGDDFVVILAPEAVEDVCQDVIAAWDGQIGRLYDSEDLDRGYILVKDRRDQMNYFPVMTVTIGIATNSHRPITSHWEASEIATEMKQFAKREPKSCYAIDRRRARDDGLGVETLGP